MSGGYWLGMGVGASLIMAIGAQNAHVLRMGLRRQHVGLTVATCVIIDALLIAAGVAGMGAVIQSSPLLLSVARWGGAVFLLGYGLRALRAAWHPQTLVAGDALSITAPRAVTTALALSLLNPHVYLDTVVLLGAIGGQQPAASRLPFALGAMTASLLWFGAIGFGAKSLAHRLDKPNTWRAIDLLTGVMMLSLAVLVASGG
jgi:L-lysine exporter family protein LysE/ArgO